MVHCFCGRVRRDRFFTKLTTPSRLLEAAEWDLVRQEGVLINPHGTSLQLPDRTLNLGVVRGVNGSSKAVVGVIGNLDSLGLVLEANERCNWTEDLLLADLHVHVNITKDSRSHKVALVSEASAASDELGLLLALLDVGKNLVELQLADLWALEGLWVLDVSDLEGLCGSNKEFEELVVDRVLDQDTRSGITGLTHVFEYTECSPLGSFSKVGLVKDDVW